MREAFGKEMRETFGTPLLGLSLSSFSLGEARTESDVDYFILIDRIEKEYLEPHEPERILRAFMLLKSRVYPNTRKALSSSRICPKLKKTQRLFF